MTRTPAADRHTYLPSQIVGSDGSCNAFSKTRDNAFGITAANIQVAAWYDRGDDTPIAVPANSATPYVETAAIRGNRAVVEASYHFDFIVPFISIFTPNGINVKMRSARTIMSAGDEPNNCTLNTPPPFSMTASATRTRTGTRTRTPTQTVTATPTPACGLSISSAFICRTSNQNNTPSDWQASITVVGYQPGFIVTVNLNNNSYIMTCNALGDCTYYRARRAAYLRSIARMQRSA